MGQFIHTIDGNGHLIGQSIFISFIMIDITLLDKQNQDAIADFYAIGSAIRKSLSAAELNWTDDYGLEQFIQKEGIEVELIRAKGNGHLGRIAVIRFDNQPDLGILGWYECGDDDAVSQALLEAATKQCRAWGCKKVIGPMNGSTWNAYRFNLTADKPLLPGDPYQPLYYVRQWRDFGFTDKAVYQSDLAPSDLFQPMTLEEGKELAKQFNLSVDYYPADNQPDFLKKMYQFYHDCFSMNPLFQSISQDDFDRLSDQFAKILNRDCSLIVRDRENKPVSVLLAYRDVYHELYAAGKTTDPDHQKKRLFIKTIATHPDYQGKQIGTLLVNLTQNLAKEAGYEEIYHMLMYKDNLSATKGKEKFVTKKVREYALMEKSL